jgi:trigger factor
MAEIGNKMGVKVSSQEVQNGAIAYATQSGQENPEQIYKNIVQNRGALMAIQASLFEEKVVEALIAKANITEQPSTLEAIQQAIERLEDAAAEKVNAASKSEVNATKVEAHKKNEKPASRKDAKAS